MAPSDENKPNSQPSRWRGLPFPWQMLLGLLFVGAVFFLIPKTLVWLRKPQWYIPAMLLLVPLLIVVIDVAQGKMRPLARNLAFGYLIYIFRITFLLGVQFAAIPILFLVGPVWLFASFFTVVDVVVRLIPGVESSDATILCQFVKLDQPYCLPALIAYHTAMALLAFVVARYGERLLDAAAEGYRRGVEWLEQQVQ